MGPSRLSTLEAGPTRREGAPRDGTPRIPWGAWGLQYRRAEAASSPPRSASRRWDEASREGPHESRERRPRARERRERPARDATELLADGRARERRAPPRLVLRSPPLSAPGQRPLKPLRSVVRTCGAWSALASRPRPARREQAGASGAMRTGWSECRRGAQPVSVESVASSPRAAPGWPGEQAITRARTMERMRRHWSPTSSAMMRETTCPAGRGSYNT